MWRAIDDPTPRDVPAVVRALATLPALTNLDMLSKVMEVPLAPLRLVVNAAIHEGLVECHDIAGEPEQVIILSPLGAECASVHLSDDSLAWVLDYTLDGDDRMEPDPAAVSAGMHAHQLSAFMAREGKDDMEGDLFIDARMPEPERIVMAAEEIIERAFMRARSGIIPGNVPRPRSFYEGGTWPRALNVLDNCHPSLSLTGYCLWCDASGADHLMPRLRKVDLPRPGSYSFEAGELDGGIERHAG